MAEIGVYLTLHLNDCNKIPKIEQCLKDIGFEHKIDDIIIAGNRYYKELGIVTESSEKIKLNINSELNELFKNNSIEIHKFDLIVGPKNKCKEHMAEDENKRTRLHEAAHCIIAEYLGYSIKNTLVFGNGMASVEIAYMKDTEFAIALNDILKYNNPSTERAEKLFNSRREDFINFLPSYLKILVAGEMFEFLYDFDFNTNGGQIVLNSGSEDIIRLNKLENVFNLDKIFIEEILIFTIEFIKKNKNKIEDKAGALYSL
jgi:hypothetical protein